MTYDVVCADVMEWAAGYKGEPFAAMLTDAPYEYGFMGKSWDNSGISYQVETWAALAEHLLPGAFLMTFGGARSWHRIAVAIEDAGLIMHPSIFGWAYGSGFPKATRIDTQIDKANGNVWEDRFSLGRHIREQRELQGLTQDEVNQLLDGKLKCQHYESTSHNFARVPTLNDWNILKDKLCCSDEWDSLVDRFGAKREVIGNGKSGKTAIWNEAGNMGDFDITAPATDLATQWQGHRYGLQAMKPALEPILLFQKPWTGKRLDCIVETGAGALNIEKSRIGTELVKQGREGCKTDGGYGKGYGAIAAQSLQGRWPSNFCLTHVSPDADGNGGCVRDGVRRVKSDKNTPRNPVKKSNPYHLTADNFDNKTPDAPWGYADADGREEVVNWVCEPTCPIRRIGEQSGERSSGGRTKKAGDSDDGQWRAWEGRTDRPPTRTTDFHLDKSKGTAARFYFNADWSYEVAERLAGADAVQYCAKAAKRGREAGLFGIIGCANCGGLETETHVNEHGRTVTCRRNDHSTVKPIALTQWLATLLLPPDAYAPRRILIPFAGSGSEALGAMLAGWEHITLVEMDSEYCEIARARLAWWTEQANGQMWPDVKEILKNAK